MAASQTSSTSDATAPRRQWRRVGTHLSAYACGGAVSLLVDFYLLPLWFETTWITRAKDWLLGGSNPGGYQWLGVWDHIPAWAVALGVGIVIGTVARRSWLARSVVVGAGYVTIPHLYLIAVQAHPMVFWPFLSDFVAIPVTTGGAWLVVTRPLTRWRAHQRKKRGSTRVGKRKKRSR